MNIFLEFVNLLFGDSLVIDKLHSLSFMDPTLNAKHCYCIEITEIVVKNTKIANKTRGKV